MSANLNNKKESGKILFAGFNSRVSDSIKDTLSKTKRQNISNLNIVFENDVQEVKDIVASDFVDITVLFLNINPKYIDGIAGVCGYVANIASLVRDALESDISVVVSCPSKRHAIATLLDELDKKQGEDFRVMEYIDTEYFSTLIENIQKTKQQKYATV